MIKHEKITPTSKNRALTVDMIAASAFFNTWKSPTSEITKITMVILAFRLHGITMVLYNYSIKDNNLKNRLWCAQGLIGGVVRCFKRRQC